MKYIELPQKISILTNLILESKILIVALMVMLVLIFMLVNKNISKRKYFVLTGVCLLVSLIITIITNNKNLFVTFDNVMNNVFMNIYFPSVEFYIFMLIVMLIFAINSVINLKVNKMQRLSNISMFFINFFLFISFLITIATKKLDIFDKASIYTNQDAIVLLQLSTSVFVIWILVNLFIYIVNIVVERINVKNDVKLEEVLVADNSSIIENVVDDMPYNVILEDDTINKDMIIDTVIDKTSEVEEDSFLIENPVIDENTKFSLDEYRTFNRMLKTSILLNSYKDSVTMDDMLNPNSLGEYTEEEYNIYKKMLVNYMS